MTARFPRFPRPVQFVSLILTTLVPPAYAQQAPPAHRAGASASAASLQLDMHAVYKTHVRHLSDLGAPHINDDLDAGLNAGSMQGLLPLTTVAFTGVPYGVGPAVTPTTTAPEAEEDVAVDPNDSTHLIEAISDFALNGGFNTTKYVISHDGGTTWVENYIPLDPLFGLPVTRDGYYWFANSDPTVAIDKHGYTYLADLYLDAIDNGNGLYVSVAPPNSADVFTDANTFPIRTNPSSSTIYFEDKPWLTVDNSNSVYSGSVYACWSHFVGNTTDHIVISHSRSHGQTWSSPLRISPSSQDGAVQGCDVAVGPNGYVYVTYELFYTGNNRQHFLAKSTNGGGSFSLPVAISPIFPDLNFTSTYRKNSFVSLAVNPVSSYVYGIYAVQSSTTGSDIEFIHSTVPNGKTFTAPVSINDSSLGQRFFPALAVDSAGVIHTSWFDTRNSATNSEFYDIYAGYSSTGGTSFSTNARVTSATIDAGTTTFIGDYAGIAASANTAHPVWTNGGGNNGQLQTATLTVP